MDIFAEILKVGGKTNSLGRVEEVIEVILNDRSRLDELYDCLFDKDVWVRMRAIDALEKICRKHPDWLLPYVDRFLSELATSTQPSIQWHLAQMYNQVELTDVQRQFAIIWLEKLISTKEVDWIASAYGMDTLAQFTRSGWFPVTKMVALLIVQLEHKSKAVVKRASKLLDEFSVKT